MTPTNKRKPQDRHPQAPAEANLPNPREADERQASALLHELQMLQVALEMQNETFRRAQIDRKKSRDRYADLYEFAPVGYATVASDGVITKINLKGGAGKTINLTADRLLAIADAQLYEAKRGGRSRTCCNGTQDIGK